MANGLAVGDGGVATVQRAWFDGDRAGLAAVRADLFRRHGLALLLEQGVEGAFGQAACGRAGELFEGGEVDLESRAGVAEGPPRDNFAPLGRHFTDLTELFRG
jgi:hypothetical protein